MYPSIGPSVLLYVRMHDRLIGRSSSSTISSIYRFMQPRTRSCTHLSIYAPTEERFTVLVILSVRLISSQAHIQLKYIKIEIRQLINEIHMYFN